MEAATPLPFTHVRVVGDRVVVDGLVVHDETTVRLVRDHADPAKLLEDAVAIGARVLDREQAGTNVELVKGELEKATRDAGQALTETATRVTTEIDAKLVELLGPENGHLVKALSRHFSDDSSAAVQHRVRAVMEEVMVKSREELRRQFSSADGNNPLAQFQRAAVDSIKAASDQQHAHLRAMQERLAGLQLEIQKLQAEREKQEELDAEREKGTAKGRTFEELVHEAIDRIALPQGDDCEAVGDVKEATGKKGDIVVAIGACSGPARGRIVFEAKNARLTRPRALEELDGALRERNADYAVLVVPSEDKVPARMHALREYNGDKLIVAFDPEEDTPLALQVAYALARARVLMARGDGEEIDAAALRDTVERAVGAMEDVRRVKQQLTGAKTQIDKAAEIVDAMAARVRGHLEEIDALLAPVSEGAGPGIDARLPPASDGADAGTDDV
jgi:hypothetical protein